MNDDERRDLLRTSVGEVLDPELRRPLGELGMVGDITFDSSGAATVEIRLTVATCPAADQIEREVVEAARAVPDLAQVTVVRHVMTKDERRELRAFLRPDGKRENPFGSGTLTRVIAVTSGKGGVGKSTVTVNVAAELARRGFAVGLIDADVFGFSIPALLGLVDNGRAVRPVRIDDMIVPPVAHGIKALSIGMFVDDSSVAVAWRGPMLQRTISQFLSDAWFGSLDFLLLDLPPGTGDVAITVGQLLPNAEVVIVTTPQSSASDVAVRSGSLALQLGQRILGVIENMVDIGLPDGTHLDVFGHGGGDMTALRLQSQVLGSIPLSVALRQDADAGIPVVLAHPEDEAAKALRTITDTLTRRPGGQRTSLGVRPVN